MSKQRPHQPSAPGSPKARKKPVSKQKASESEPIGQPTADVMSMKFTDADTAPTLAPDRNRRCKKCGNVCINGQCTACKYIEPVFENLYSPIDHIPIQIAGFQLWFCRTMNEGIPISVMKYLSHAMVGLIALFLLIVAGFGLSGYGIHPVLAGILVILVVGCVSLYSGLIYKGRDFLRNPNARLAWFQKPFWQLLLIYSRKLDWQGYDTRCKGRKIVTFQDEAFGDFEFSQLQGILKCQVLDLEGTDVSDKTIERLYAFKHLHCVVLKGTSVTHESVFRFQQSFPRIWIWY